MAKQKKRQSYQQVDVIPPSCPACGSTEREGYTNVKSRDMVGTTASGQPYTRVTWKRTTCKACGQRRIDRVFENLAIKYESRTTTPVESAEPSV